MSPADDDREAALKAFEREAARLPFVFAREQVGRACLVTLTGIAVDSRMPTRRVMWSQAFPDEMSRDDLFAWLAQRVERWEDWGRLAYSSGADAFTQRLLALLVANGFAAS